MKLQSLALALVGFLSSVAAQGMTGLPSCAQDCATGAIPSQCSLIDVECICAERSFVDDMACCVGQSCAPEDQDAALDFANGICGGAGISDLPQSATCAGDSTSTTTASPTETTTSGDEATTTTSEPTETATTTSEGDETSTDPETSTESGTATETSNDATEADSPTSTETPTDPEETGGAVLLRGKEVGVLAGIVAGAAFVL
ncbi:hypothetical protein BDW62DRAFT_149970 [Aspergillus aurantiobrunneus]